eukprot:s2723_g15.t1
MKIVHRGAAPKAIGLSRSPLLAGTSLAVRRAALVAAMAVVGGASLGFLGVALTHICHEVPEVHEAISAGAVEWFVQAGGGVLSSFAVNRHGFEICGALVVTATGILIIDVILARTTPGSQLPDDCSEISGETNEEDSRLPHALSIESATRLRSSRTGLQAAESALRSLPPHRRLHVLDAGCGSGGQLLEIYALAQREGAPVYLRGVTAETNAVPDQLRDKVVNLLAPPEKDPPADDPVDLKLFQGFPLENLKEVDTADFIREGIEFDLILCSWTLFHLCDPLGTLEQLYRCLAPEGLLLANGAYMHFEAPGNEEGSIPAFEAFCARLAPELQLCVEGEPVCYFAEDPDDEWGAGEYRGGFALSLAWRRGSATAPAGLSEHCLFTGQAGEDF